VATRKISRKSSKATRKENIRRSQEAGVPVGTEPEKPVRLKVHRKNVKKSANVARKAKAKQLRRPAQGGGVSPR
jgi:hypothetical protein